MKKIWQYLYVILLLSGFQITLSAQSNIRVGIIISNNDTSRETRAAIQFLQNAADVNGFYLNTEDVVNHPGLIDQVDVFWIHTNDSVGLTQIRRNKSLLHKISRAV